MIYPFLFFITTNYKNTVFTQDLFLGFCTLLASLVQHPELATSFKLNSFLMKRLQTIHQEVSRKANIKKAQLAQKQKQQFQMSFVKNQARSVS
jgi:hypothetical protein